MKQMPNWTKRRFSWNLWNVIPYSECREIVDHIQQLLFCHCKPKKVCLLKMDSNHAPGDPGKTKKKHWQRSERNDWMKEAENWICFRRMFCRRRNVILMFHLAWFQRCLNKKKFCVCRHAKRKTIHLFFHLYADKIFLCRRKKALDSWNCC